MALQECSKCLSSISEKANKCPKCGYGDPFKQKTYACSECSSQILLDSKICPECGYPGPFESRLLGNDNSQPEYDHPPCINNDKISKILHNKPWLADSTADIFVHRRKTQRVENKDRIYCSFCYHDDLEVFKLIQSGEDTFICDECAADSNSVMELLKYNMVTNDVVIGRCSFCDKEYKNVDCLFSNFENGKYICNECAELCSIIFKEEFNKEAFKGSDV